MKLGGPLTLRTHGQNAHKVYPDLDQEARTPLPVHGQGCSSWRAFRSKEVKQPFVISRESESLLRKKHLTIQPTYPRNPKIENGKGLGSSPHEAGPQKKYCPPLEMIQLSAH